MMPRYYTPRGLQPGDLKECPHCHQILPLTLTFWKRGRSSAGFRAYCRPCDARQETKYRQQSSHQPESWTIKLTTLQAYGSVCRCCGESEPVFLTFDHIEGGGAQHRRDEPLVKKNIAKWLQQQNYPNGYQVLCFNCHKAKDAGPKHLQGRCPHEYSTQTTAVRNAAIDP